MTQSTPDIAPDDLPEELRQIADIIGLEAVLALVAARGGESIYIPKAERVSLAARNRAIREAFDGRNHNELARRFNLSVTWIRAIVGDESKAPSGASRLVDMQKQMPLF